MLGMLRMVIVVATSVGLNVLVLKLFKIANLPCEFVVRLEGTLAIRLLKVVVRISSLMVVGTIAIHPLIPVEVLSWVVTISCIMLSALTILIAIASVVLLLSWRRLVVKVSIVATLVL